MKLLGLAIEFRREGAAVFPVDPQLHRLAVLYAEQNLTETVNLSDYAKVYVSAEVDEKGTPVRIHGLLCEQPIPDFPVVRFTDTEAGDVLFERARASLEDRGWRGRQVLLHIADHEPRDSRCPQWRKFLRKFGAVKASRWAVTIR